MRKYGFVKIEHDDPISIVCTWNENFINRLVDNTTNTICIKPVRDLVTGTLIRQDPFEYWDGESINVKTPKHITYLDGPFSITEQEAKAFLVYLKEHPEKLMEYVEYLNRKEIEARLKRSLER